MPVYAVESVAQSTSCDRPKRASVSDAGHRPKHTAKAQPRHNSRPATAPAGRVRGNGARESAVRPSPSEVNLNKVAPLGTAPRWTMRGRHEPLVGRTATPGPGHYDQVKPDDYWCSRKPSFSMAKTRKHTTSVRPGPTDYVAEAARSGPAWFISTCRNEGNLRTQTPGPGAYDVPTCKSGIQHSMSALGVDQLQQPLTPGPGTYELEVHGVARHDAPRWSFGTANREFFKQSPFKRRPGPGDYDPGSADLVKKPQWTLGAKREHNESTRERKVGATYTQFA